MKELKSKIKIAKQNNFKNSVQQAFEGYELVYKKFSDTYELKNKDFKHSIWYNLDKDSKVKTQRSKEANEIVIANVGLLLLLGLSFYLNRKFGWFEESMTFLWIYLLLTVLVNWIIDKMKPHYRQQLQEEHDRIINYLKTMQE